MSKNKRTLLFPIFVKYFSTKNFPNTIPFVLFNIYVRCCRNSPVSAATAAAPATATAGCSGYNGTFSLQYGLEFLINF